MFNIFNRIRDLEASVLELQRQLRAVQNQLAGFPPPPAPLAGFPPPPGP